MGRFAQRATDGAYYVWVPVMFTPSAQSLAHHLWDGMTSAEIDAWHAGKELSVRQVRAAVERSLRYRGAGWPGIDGDEDGVWTNEGGEAWAVATVRRVYRFPEE